MSIRTTLVILAAALVLSAAIIGTTVLRAHATTPLPYALYDASDTYLGDVVGIGPAPDMASGMHLSYATYIPSMGIIVDIVKRGATISIGDELHETFFTSLNCEGTAYTSSGNDVPWDSLWVVEALGDTYTVGTTTIESVETNSYTTNSECVNETIPAVRSNVFLLTPITLPYSSVALPLELRSS